MRLTRWLLPSAAAALSLAAAAGGLAAAQAARADTTGPSVNLMDFHQMVADKADGYLFLSAGSTDAPSTPDGLVVTDLSGALVTRLHAGDGVKGLALKDGTLYAALAGKGEVAAISVSTITQSQPAETLYPLSPGDAPYGLAVQSGKLWVSYSNQASPGAAIGDIDLSTGTFEPASAEAANWTSAPDLAADPGDNGVLVAAEPSHKPMLAATYNTAVTPVVAIAAPAYLGGASGATSCGFQWELAVVPGGGQFISACFSVKDIQLFSTTDLTTPVHSYANPDSSPEGPTSVAVAPDGAVAVGTTDTRDLSSIDVYKPDGTLVNILPVSPGLLANASLAWSSDGSLYALRLNTDATDSVLSFSSPELTRSSLSMTAPASAWLAAPVSVTGKLALSTGPAASAAVTVTRTNPDHSVTSLPTAQTDPNGSFTINDTPPAVGAYTYTASYAGTATTAPAQATASVTVALNTATLTLAGPSTVVPGKGYSVTGKLAYGTGSPAAGTPVTVTRKNPNGSVTAITGIKTDAGGAFTINDKQTALGTYAYSASYAGNATTGKATASFKVTIAKAAGPLTLVTVPAPNALYGTTVKVQAHLGPTYSNHTVSLYYQLAGTSVRRLIETAKVNSSGYLIRNYTSATRNVIFTATFSGDAQYLARSVSVREGVAVRIVMTNGGYFTSNTFNGTTYRVYHHTSPLTATVTVTPGKPGECVRLGVQELVDGTWVNNVTTGCGTLNGSSKVAGEIILTNADLGFRFRIHAAFYPSSKDVTNVGYHTGWFYFQVVK